MNTSTQILVIGGGPAGSTVATLLAREGFEVTIIEKEVFPRYHVGESLLPSCLEILDLIGAREKVEAYGFVRKEGGWFDWGQNQWHLDFDKLRHPYSFQVIRSEFDQLLLEHAKEQGVKVYEGVEIKSLVFEGERPVRAAWAATADPSQSGEIAFDLLVDASGRAGIMVNRYLKNRHFHDAFQNVGVWSYWRNADSLAHASKGAIVVGAIDDGWLWHIPLHDKTHSVGLVLHKTVFKEKRQQGMTPEQIYMKAIQGSPLISGLLTRATREMSKGFHVEQDYSYMADELSGPGYFITGDAGCFIDPLLSTGVHLATHGAMLAGASIASMLRGEITPEEARLFYEHSYRHSYLRLMVIVSGLYQQYDGPPAYFWQAQALTHNDYSDPEALDEAFLYVVTGMEDLRDIEEATPQELAIEQMAGQLPEGQAQRAKAMYNVYNKVFLRSSMSEKTAIDDMYVVTQPHLGIASVQKQPAAPA